LNWAQAASLRQRGANLFPVHFLKEAKVIKEHGGIGDEKVANKRRPKGTGCIAKKNS